MATNNSKNRPSNYVILTLCAIADGEQKVSGTAKSWAKVRAFLSQGKDKDTGEYKPSMFFDVMAFSKDAEPNAPVSAIAQIARKDHFTVKGNLAMEEWTGKEDGVKHQTFMVYASSVEPFSFEKESASEELEGEPA